MIGFIFLFSFNVLATEPCKPLFPVLDQKVISQKLVEPNSESLKYLRDQLSLRLDLFDDELPLVELIFFEKAIESMKIPTKLSGGRDVLEQRVLWESKRFELHVALIKSKKQTALPVGYVEVKNVDSILRDARMTYIDRVKAVKSYLYIHAGGLSPGAAAYVLTRLDQLPDEALKAPEFVTHYKLIANQLDSIVASAR